MTGTRAEASVPLPAAHDARVLRVFRWYVRRMFRKEFAAVRITRDSSEPLAALSDSHKTVVAMNHQSWWDPLVGLLLAERYVPDAVGLAPMDHEMLERFRFMRKLGIFGIDPDAPESSELMSSYVCDHFGQHDRATLWLTPEGRFVDPRSPPRPRPGMATVAARLGDVRCFSIAVEYAFRIDKKPEVLLRATEINAPDEPSVPGWHRAITRTMRENARLLAQSVIARDLSAFQDLSGGAATPPSPVYALWLKLRGRGATLESERTTGAKEPAHPDGRPA